MCSQYSQILMTTNKNWRPYTEELKLKLQTDITFHESCRNNILPLFHFAVTVFLQVFITWNSKNYIHLFYYANGVYFSFLLFFFYTFCFKCRLLSHCIYCCIILYHNVIENVTFWFTNSFLQERDDYVKPDYFCFRSEGGRISGVLFFQIFRFWKYFILWMGGG